MKNNHFILLLNLFLILVIVDCSQENDKMKKETQTESQFLKVVDNQDFPEGPAWDGKNTLYVSNCYGGWITKIESTGYNKPLKVSDEPFILEKTNGLTFFKDGSIFACDIDKRAIIKINPERKSEIYASEFEGKQFNRPNDLAFDPNGNLYFTDPNKYDPTILDGYIYKVDAFTKEVTQAATDLAFPNGLAFSTDGKYLYVCESAKHRVIKFELGQNGNLINPNTFVEMPGGDPDGCNFDQEGNLYVAHFGGGAIWVINPDGSVKEKIKTPGKKPSNVEFGDSDLRTLFITEDESNCVYKMRIEVPGLKLFCSPE
jgi:gluconolactonase